MRSKVILFTSAVLSASTIPASALSLSAQLNCVGDYYAYCSMHTAGSAGCHACMRANRQKLSSSCVSSLIDDGVLPKVGAAQNKAKVAVTTAKAKPVPRSSAGPSANPVAKTPSAKVAAVRPTPEAASPVADALPSAQPETPTRAPELPATPPQQPVAAAPAIDQQTFEALKNRAPYFLATMDIASMFALTEESASPQAPPAPR
jgi:hypothetical protein